MLRPLLSLFLFLLAGLSGAVAAGRVEIPFEMVDGFILVKAQVGGEPVSMVLDSGAGATVLSLDTAERLHLAFGTPQTVQGAGIQSVAYALSNVNASVDGFVFSGVSLAVDLKNASLLCSRPVDGLIGVDFFLKRVVEIDFASGRLRVLPGSLPSPAGTCHLPLKAYHGTLCVPISVNGSEPRLARLDTGCNDALHWVVPKTAERRHRNVSIGFLTDISNMTLSDLRMDSEFLPKIETSLHARPLFPGEAGLVGTGVLSRYTVTVDCLGNQLLLRPRP